MQDTKPTQDKSTDGEKPKAPKMVKPVTGTIKESKKKLGVMLKKHRKDQKSGNKDVR